MRRMGLMEGDRHQEGDLSGLEAEGEDVAAKAGKDYCVGVLFIIPLI